MLVGSIKRDQYGLLWVYNGADYDPIIIGATGEQVSSSDQRYRQHDVSPFTPEEDPSNQHNDGDPRLISRLQRIEDKLDELLNRTNI